MNKEATELIRLAQGLSPSEALFGFGGWLTTRDEEITMSGHSDCAAVAEAIGEFCDANNLAEPQGHWENNLVFPKSRRGADKAMTKEETARRSKKTTSVRKLAEQINGLRQKVTLDLKSDDEKTRLTALAITLMDKTASRVGNDESAKEGHFGVTGWRGKHLTVSGDTITVKYVGKSGVDQEKQVTDKTIAKLLKQCQANCKGKDSTLLTTSDGFQINAAKVNRYLKDYGITAKDIRGYAANQMLVEILKRGEKSSDPEERKKKFKEAIKTVAEKVGHQQATLKMHYLLPGMEESYVTNGKVPSVKNASIADRVGREFTHDQIATRVAAMFLSRLNVGDPVMAEIDGDTIHGNVTVVSFSDERVFYDIATPDGVHQMVEQIYVNFDPSGRQV